LQRNFVFVVLIDCALAKLLAEGSIAVAEIFVFSRAIEDVVDLLLIRSRSESELATLMTQVDKLKVLDEVWSKSKEARLLPCRIENAGGDIVLNNLQYSRGTAEVSVEHLVIKPGIYAVTGANGSGKSTGFRLLMACSSNEGPIDLHESIELATPLHQWELSDKLILPEDSCKVPDEGCEVIEKEDSKEEGEAEEIPVPSITMPSSDIVEISQTFYWPLYSKPIDWIYQKHITSDLNETERKECVHRVAEELQSLSFAQSQAGSMANINATENSSDTNAVDNSNESIIEKLVADLQEEKEDWFSELSGGQKSKVHSRLDPLSEKVLPWA
jgi:ATPase subunit of ABC transporter with duplicated ATPase domains